MYDAATAQRVGPAGRVVIATGEPAIARIISHKLGREGNSVITVATSDALDAALFGRDIDVALVEPALADGALATIASRLTTGWLAIVDGRDPLAGERAMRSGAAGLVRTPFKPTEVAAQVATLLTLKPR